MSTEAPPPLYELAKQSLLKSKAIISAVQQGLPKMIFHDLFMDAFMREHNEALKEMVQAWPWHCLPLKSLMNLRESKMTHKEFQENSVEQRNLRTLEALLEGIDIPLSQDVHHRKWNLEVLDWSDGHEDFWTRGPRAMSAAHTAAHTRRKDTDSPALYEKKQTLIVFAKLHLDYSLLESDTHLHFFKWVKQRKPLVQLHSKKVMIAHNAVYKFLKVLRAVQLDSIMELEVFANWNRTTMEIFVPILKKMKNLHTFRFSSLDPEWFTSPSRNKYHSRLYASHLRKLESLHELHIDKVFFLHGTLHKIIRNQTHLEVLALSSSPLKESDLQYLSQCEGTRQLKSLTLRRIKMASFSPQTLQVLLNTLAGSLETLALEHCNLSDAKVLDILPSLSCCSRLKTFSCLGNPLSMGILQVLLRVSANLSQLTRGLYPAPLESYDPECLRKTLQAEQFAQVCAELAQVLSDIRPSLKAQICTYTCEDCSLSRFYRLELDGKWEVTEEFRYRTSSLYVFGCDHYQKHEAIYYHMSAPHVMNVQVGLLTECIRWAESSTLYLPSADT